MGRPIMIMTGRIDGRAIRRAEEVGGLVQAIMDTGKRGQYCRECRGRTERLDTNGRCDDCHDRWVELGRDAEEKEEE